MIEVLIFGLSENQGGIETYLLKIWNRIDQNRYHFNFIDMTGNGCQPCFFEELSKSGCTFFKVTPRHISVKRNKKDLNKLFRENDFDILHYNINTASYLLPIKIALKNDVRVIVHSRNAGASNNILTNCFHIINRQRLSRMDIHRIAVSKLAGKWLFGERTNFDVFNNGIDVDRFSFDKNARSCVRRAILGEKEEETLILGNVGAFLPAKNHRFLVDVFEEVLRKKTNSVLWLVGTGPEIDDIQKYVNEKNLKDFVFFLGRRDDMPSIYSALDFFVFPSLYEGFPNALLEAECSGLICFKSSCITDEINICEGVFSLNLSDGTKKWADCICEEVERTQYSNHSRNDNAAVLRRSPFSVNQEIIRLETLYNQVITSK